MKRNVFALAIVLVAGLMTSGCATEYVAYRPAPPSTVVVEPDGTEVYYYYEPDGREVYYYYSAGVPTFWYFSGGVRIWYHPVHPFYGQSYRWHGPAYHGPVYHGPVYHGPAGRPGGFHGGHRGR